ncbi:MAG TPA: ATP-binding protein [Phycisphaerae bacterium]|jgi:signal transduction histidine kinase/ActR/RegA family two-component response regulator
MADELPLNTAPEMTRVLLLPPTSRDAQAMRKVFDSNGIAYKVCPDLPALCAAVPVGAGAVIISEESLASDHHLLAQCVSAQPVWSDLPIIVLSRSGTENPLLTQAIPTLGNVSVLERPVRLTTLLSIVRSALRARERQYQVRAHLRQRKESLDAERAARIQAQRAGQMKDEFLATLSHELRTPLNAILGWAHILKTSEPSAEDITEGIDIIERNARAQTQIIEDLLDMSRIVSGKIRLQIQTVDLAAVIQAAIDTVRPAADAKRIRLSLPPESFPAFHGDPSRLQQVLWNLLTNAIRFTPAGGEVKIQFQGTHTQFQIAVVDTGEGIDPDFLPHVFDRFRQADSTTTRHHGGLGLGLAIVKQLIELHGGSVHAASAGKGSGATFTITLPLVSTAVDSHPAPPAPVRDAVWAPLTNGRNIAGARILVVDDEPDARTVLRRLFESLHATVFDAAFVDQALLLVESEHPHVIISDIGMPGQDGYSFIRRLRALPPERGGTIPALALTAYAREQDRESCLAAGFQEHLSKPFDAAQVIANVSNLLPHKEDSHASS